MTDKERDLIYITRLKAALDMVKQAEQNGKEYNNMDWDAMDYAEGRCIGNDEEDDIFDSIDQIESELLYSNR
jgi:hypothetical protein